ncbi:MAG: methyltransferase domain-containing protein [Hydrogenophaga sp.]|uniref:class I SAM-dependent methyltransferase n=1 Tax=Hydrogenophaga sp. TaxID=1904254 RepID=UPI0025BA5FD4|nr:class I SAM-dependent methyltransferase [Hydrogenophaga sp.]MBT9550647.1 methyltransferase domain-containing protein [Hydrogenophaga sp.]
MIRKFINFNIRASKLFDQLLPESYKTDGNRDFKNSFALQYITSGTHCIDIGGGKNPFIPNHMKNNKNIYVTGIDIDQDELNQAPKGSYDHIKCADIQHIVGNGDADLCICQAVLEHVPDVEAAFKSMSTLLKPGGIAIIFVPSRNALFARLNLILPEKIKRKILFSIFPNTQRNQGFPSYYNRCTPVEFRSISEHTNLEVIDSRYYYTSSYFSFFTPLYIAWRFWIIVYKRMMGEQAAETFSMALRKRA